MIKGFLRATILVAFCLPGIASALGMGEIEAHSYLNQPLNARIPLKSYDPSDIKGLKVSLASESEFARAGVEYTPVLKGVRFKVVLDPKTKTHYIRVYTTTPVRDAYLNFLIEVNWPQGRLIREYTLLLDPPDMSTSTAPGIDMVETQEPEEAQKPAATPPAVTTRAGSQSIVYGPVRLNETLWDIAERIRGDRRDISIEQIIIALQRSNPNAFINNNVNNLKAGVILRIDNPNDIRAISRSEAQQEFHRQYQAWLDYKRRRSANPQQQKQSQSLQQQQPADGSARDGQGSGGTLKLVPPQGDDKQLGQSEQTATDKVTQERITQLQGQLDTALTEAESGRQENAVLRDRLKALEEQLAALQRVVTVKSDELASLQQQLQGEKESLEQEIAADTVVEEEVIEPEAVTTTEATHEPVDVEVIKTPTEPGFIDKLAKGVQSWYQNPLQTGIIGGLLVLLSILVLVFVRQRRKARENLIYSSNLEKNARYQDDYFEPDTADSWDTESGFEAEMEGGMPDDPMAQADIFIAFGKFDEAVELMEQAIEADPENLALKVKLDDILNLKTAKPRVVSAAELQAAAAEAEEEFEGIGTSSIESAEAAETLMDEGEIETPVDDPFAGLSEHDIEIVPIDDDHGDDQLDYPNYGSDYTKPYEGSLISEDEISTFHKEIHTEPQASGIDLPEDDVALEPIAEGLDEAGADDALEFNVDDLSFSAEEPEGPAEAEPASSSAALDFDLGDLEGLEGVEDQLAELESIEPQDSAVEFDTDGLDDLMDINIEPEPAPSTLESEADLDWPEESATSTEADDFSDEEIADLQDLVAEEDIPESGLDFDLDTELTSALDELEAEMEMPDIDLSSDEDVDLLNTVDEVGTKLDLAKAYMDMGDPDGARSILEEVQQEGNAGQKQEAGELLEQLLEMV